MTILECVLILLLFSSCRTLGNLSIPVLPISPTSSSKYNSVTDDSIPLESYDPIKKGSIINEEVYDSYATHKKLQTYKSHDHNDFSFFMGKYVSRQGILKELGDVGPTLGIELSVFSPFIDSSSNPTPVNHGWFLLWTFDHFWKTNKNLLKPEFSDQDYTNYMLGGGYAFRWIINPSFQLHYRGGLALNFIEIDTFRSNGDMNDGKYSDITLSTIHKFGVDVVVKKAHPEKWKPGTQIRIGPSVFYYLAPDPLGEFKLTDNSKVKGPGGSLAAYLEIKFEIY